MIRKISISTLLLYSISIFSQTQIKVLDAENKTPIPYAKLTLKDKDYYKNTEENGETFLNKDEEIVEIQSFGYENLIIKNSQTTYFIHPKFKEIEEVEIARPKLAKSFISGSIKKDNFGFMANKTSWNVVNFYENNFTGEKIFIKKIKIPTEVKEGKPDAVFNLVFYENINEKPASEKFRNIIITCKKGKSINEIDFSKNPIPFPKEGLFIGIEWIINEQNHYLTKTTKINPDGSKEKNVIVDRTNPFFFGYESQDSNTLGKSQNGWYKIFNGKIIPDQYNLSLELELTD